MGRKVNNIYKAIRNDEPWKKVEKYSWLLHKINSWALESHHRVCLYGCFHISKIQESF